MSTIVSRPNSSLVAAQTPDTFTRTEGRDLARLQNREVARGLIASTRVQAAGMVAATGLQITGMLSREAAFQSNGDPNVAARLDHIVDCFAEYVGAEVARFRF
ncbi:hypothetical protein ACWDUD_16530 [Rhodococcus sp. NPDC003382]